MSNATEVKEKPGRLPRGNSFYSHYYHYVWIGLIAIVFLVIIGVAVSFYLAAHRPLPLFYAVNPQGEKMDLTSYDEPNLLPDTIITWASKAATLAYTFDYVHYNQQLAAARPYFTKGGWQDYLASVSSLIETIVQKQLIVNGVVSGPPVISNQGPLPGKGYVWRIQVPFLVTYQTANTTKQSNYMVIITLTRVPTNINPQGIGVDQFVMTYATR